MNSYTWLAIYLPMFMLLFVIIPHQRSLQKSIIHKIRREKEMIIMTNEMIKNYVGKNCKISSGSFGTTVTGEIINVNDNWIEIQTKKGKELINADFVQNIKIK